MTAPQPAGNTLVGIASTLARVSPSSTLRAVNKEHTSDTMMAPTERGPAAPVLSEPPAARSRYERVRRGPPDGLGVAIPLPTAAGDALRELLPKGVSVGGSAGTPAYMSPEQIRGDTLDPDKRYASVKELAEDIEIVLDGRTPRRPRATTTRPIRRSPRTGGVVRRRQGEMMVALSGTTRPWPVASGLCT